MKILFCHKNYPAQFGHVASALFQDHGIECAFVSEVDGPSRPGMQRIVYRPDGGATEETHYCARTFENYIAHSKGVFDALKEHPDLRPDLIVGHSGFGNTLFLRELYDCPIISYFEYFYHTRNSDMDFRLDGPPEPLDCLRARARNAGVLADLNNCDAGYSPTDFQRSLLPTEYQHRLTTIFDGVDTTFWRPNTEPPKPSLTIGGHPAGPDVPVITYVARGFESMRGFDIFMKAAALIAERRRDVLFVCVGSDRVCYGGDLKGTPYKSFREKILAEGDYPTDRMVFTGRVPPAQLAGILQRSDLHIYLTVPFVLSWSLMNALSSGCCVLASDTAPVREMIRPGENGLLADFHNPEEFAEKALAALDQPRERARLRHAARHTIEEHYSIDVCLPQMMDLYHRTMHQS